MATSEDAAPRSTFVTAKNPSYGAWCAISTGFTAQLLANAGFDWLCVDMQHGPVGYTELRSMVQAVRFTGVPAIVRVSANSPSEIMRSLDAGADGVIVPMVNTAVEAEAALSACRYPPLGTRSWGPSGAAIGREFTAAGANAEVACLVMVETREGLANVEEIAAVPGLDGIYVGPNDLALSHGLPTIPVDHGPLLTDALTRVADACRSHGITAGIAVFDPDAPAVVSKWRSLGYTFFGLASDALLLRRAAAELIDSLPSR